jgi:hypothetical protein
MPRTREEVEGSRQTAQLKTEAQRRKWSRIIELARDGVPLVTIGERLGCSIHMVRDTMQDYRAGKLTADGRRT